jgi:hypothetical protein
MPDRPPTDSPRVNTKATRIQRVLQRALALALGLTIAVLLAEFSLARIAPDLGLPTGSGTLSWMDQAGNAGSQYVVDGDMGFRPILGEPGARYCEYGALRNSYPRAKRVGVERVLFIGDSATHRGALIDGLRVFYGGEAYEYWNAGVESFNTLQELRYYERYNFRAEPDHVVLTLHNNDLRATPVAFLDPRGRLLAFDADRPTATPNPWLYQHSRLYRGQNTLRARCAQRGSESMVAEIERELGAFAGRLEARGVRFSVLVLPILAPLERWTAQELRAREQSLAMLRRLGLRHFDLLEPLERAMQLGIDPCQTLGDTWHPSRALGLAFGWWLHRRALLDSSFAGGAAHLPPDLEAPRARN